MAASTVYTTLKEVKSLLPKTYLATDLPDSDSSSYVGINSYILRASRWVDADLAHFYCTFNSTTHAEYPTPDIIRQVATDRTLYRCFSQLMATDRNGDYGALSERHKEDAAQIIGSIIGRTETGAAVMLDQSIIPNETVTAETLTFGTGATYGLPTNEAFINVHDNLESEDRPTILIDSVNVTATGLSGYQNAGTANDDGDFYVYFHPRFRKWVLRDNTGDLADLATAKTISYDFSWLRYTEKQAEATAPAVAFGGW